MNELDELITSFIRSSSGTVVPANKMEYYNIVLRGEGRTRLVDAFIVDVERIITIEKHIYSNDNSMYVLFTDSKTERKRLEYFSDLTFGEDFIDNVKGSINKVRLQKLTK